MTAHRWTTQYKQGQSIVEIARAEGSSATTTRGAMRYLKAKSADAIKYPSTYPKPIYYRGRKAPANQGRVAHYLTTRNTHRGERIMSAMALVSRVDATTTRPALPLTRIQEQYIRAWAGSTGRGPIVVTGADRAPHGTGHGYHKYSYALGNSGASHIEYIPSTYAVEVGVEWVRSMLADVHTSTKGGAECIYLRDHGYTRGQITAYPAIHRDHQIWFVTDRGKAYHATAETPLAAIAQALAGWRRQRMINRAHKAELASLVGVWVGLDDSLRAGNCQTESLAQGDRIRRALNAHGEIGGVRADYLLTLRDDAYTRRAIATARGRY